MALVPFQTACFRCRSSLFPDTCVMRPIMVRLRLHGLAHHSTSPRIAFSQIQRQPERSRAAKMRPPMMEHVSKPNIAKKANGPPSAGQRRRYSSTPRK